MIQVLFVCLGNICRSPLAEEIFRQQVADRGLSGQITCDSAGTSGWHIDQPSDPRTIDVGRKYGLDVRHLGRAFVEKDFEDFDYILAMDRSNHTDIQKVSGYSVYEAGRLKLMRDFDDNAPGADVPDPYFGEADGFDSVYHMLEHSCNNLLDFIIEKHQLQ
jgi:protein-tyrosine phosphatase